MWMAGGGLLIFPFLFINLKAKIYPVSYFIVSAGISYFELQPLCPGLLFAFSQ
jgi:hypothetical protein